MKQALPYQAPPGGPKCNSGLMRHRKFLEVAWPQICRTASDAEEVEEAWMKMLCEEGRCITSMGIQQSQAGARDQGK